MDVLTEFKWNPKVKNGLKVLPDHILYSIAKQTLDLSVPITPMSNKVGHSGTLRRSSISGGVRGSNGDFYIGSYTNYAKYVWNMPQSTNWTTPGTNNKWFARALKQHSQTIINNAINQNFKKDMQ